MTRPTPSFLAVLLLLAPLCPPTTGHADDAFDVPDGFTVTEIAGSDLANDIYTLTVDAAGRPVVAGRGYVRVLHDDDGDGVMDRATDFADAPKDGAMGLLWEGDTLYVVGDGGLRRYTDRDGDGKADGPSERLWKLGTGGEHAAHALRRGPDGWLYLLSGNHAGIDASYATDDTSPIDDPIAGVVLRFPPDFSGCHIVCDGFRNPYDFDFGLDGELFAYDSDNERCVSLPWYEPTRFYHVLPAGHYGWLSPRLAETWRLPPYWPGVVPPVTTLERGSPTGVVCYRGTSFPATYHGGFFALDWTFGNVWFVQPQGAGVGFTAEPELFLRPTGTNGFAPTDVEVDPKTGDLLLSIGGRGTRGAVYRIAYTGAGGSQTAPATNASPATGTLAWSTRPHPKAEALRTATTAAPRPRYAALIAATDEAWTSAELADLVRANWQSDDRLLRQALRRLLESVAAEHRPQLRQAAADAGPRAAVLWASVAPSKSGAATETLLAALADDAAEPWLRLEALMTLADWYGVPVPATDAHGTVYEGYGAGAPADDDAGTLDRLRTAVRDAYPTGDFALDREIPRTLARLADDDPRTVATLTAALTDESDPLDDVHLLICLSRVPAPRTAEQTRVIAHRLLDLDRKITARGRNRDRHWPTRLGRTFDGLVTQDADLPAALLADPTFGRADHALFASHPKVDRAAAAGLLADRLADGDIEATADVLALLRFLSTERRRAVLEPLWSEPALRDDVVVLLAREPRPADRPRFLEALTSADLRAVDASLKALASLPTDRSPETLGALVAALRLTPSGKGGDGLRQRLGKLLADATGADLPPTAEAWGDWLAEHHPDQLDATATASAALQAAWDQRAVGVPWSEGDAERGRAVYEKVGCARCHSGGRALGPDLQGITKRFSQQDLATAIVDPSRDVPERYRSELVLTSDGTLQQGMVIYAAADGLLLGTASGATLRLGPDDIELRQPSPRSMMPTGLLDPLTDVEVADLFAYLRSL